MSDSAEALSVGAVLAARLRELGVERVFGAPLADLPHVPVADPDLAVLLADADGRLGRSDGTGRPGAALLAGPILHLSSAPGGVAPLQTVGSVEELLDALAEPEGLELPGTVALHLDLDLSEPAPAGATASVRRERRPVITLDPAMASLRLVVLAGPGVVRAGAVEALRSFCRTAAVGVANTFGARGVERWDSPFGLGTVGLQADDLALSGVLDADVVIATGLDPAELGVAQLGQAVVQEVAPSQVGALSHGWAPATEPPTLHSALVERVARVVVPLYESDAVPLTAARASLHLSGALPERGIAVADPGPAGFWVARTFPTSVPGAVCVPATVEPGFAAAASLVCSLEGRPCLAVTDAAGAEAPATAAVVELARALGASLSLQVWGDEGRLDGSGDHVALLERHLSGDGIQVDRVPVDLDPSGLVAAAGPVTAWGGTVTGT